VTGGKYDDLPAATRRRLILRALVRPVVTTTVLLLLYYLLPLGDRDKGPNVVVLLIELGLFSVLLVWQVRKISTDEHPRMRAIESLSLSVPLFLIAFAGVYYATAVSNPEAFSQSLNRTDALYFTVTVFASVGFGDITAVTQGARVLVIIQMVGDLILVGIVARVMLGAVQAGLRRQGSGSRPG
jgi:voltage-gated potassium channel